MVFTITPIATVHNGRKEPTDDHWDNVESAIELEPDVPAESILGIGEFSHLEVLFCFHKTSRVAIAKGAEHPQENPQWPLVGILAQRKKSRPNLLGTTIVRLVGVEGKTLRVRGLDAIDGTPVVDIKPVYREFLPRVEIRQPSWATDLMQNYW